MINLAETKRDLRSINREYILRKQREPDLRPWEFVVQMLCSAYFSWRWLGGTGGRFSPFSVRYWSWLAQYSSLSELRTRASLAEDRWRKQTQVNTLSPTI